MFAVTLLATASTTKSLQLAQDCFLAGGCASGKVLVSLDPSLTIGGFEAPSGSPQPIRYDIYFYRGATTSSTSLQNGLLNIPVRKGETLFVNFSAAASAILYFNEAIPAEI